MPKVRASSGMIGTTRRPKPGSRIRFRSSLAKTIVVLTAAADAGGELGVGLGRGRRQGLRPHDPLRQGAAERAPPLEEVLDLLRVRARVEVGRVLDLLVRDRQLQAVPEDHQLRLGELLGLVGDVPALDARAQRPALDRLGQDDRGAGAELGRGPVGGVELAVVVAAPAKTRQVVVGEVLHERAQAWIRPEEVLPDVGAAGNRVLLELAVDRLVHLRDEGAVRVAGQELVPLAAPDHLDHVPPGAPEDPLQLLDDLAVAANRAVEALQVAVDHEGEVVEPLAAGEPRVRPETRARPSRRRRGRPRRATPRCPRSPRCCEVAVEAGLVDRPRWARCPC